MFISLCYFIFLHFDKTEKFIFPTRQRLNEFKQYINDISHEIKYKKTTILPEMIYML